VTWLTAIRLLRDCPAIMRVGVRTVCLLIEAIDEGRAELARDRLEVAISAKRGEAAGRAAKASSDATRRTQ
jgi:hypothetical protein